MVHRNCSIPVALALLAAAALATSPALALDKPTTYTEMLALGQQIRELKPQASGDALAASQLATALDRYRQLSAAMGGDDPAAALEAPAAVEAPSVAPAPPAGCTSIPTAVSNNTPVAIVDVATVQSQILVAGAGNYLLDLDLTTFITHSFSADLDILLTSPAGTIATITTDNGGSNDDVFNGTLWDDQAGDPASDHVYANLVTATPLTVEEALGLFVGENPNGTWTLTITDDLAGDTGSLASWSLNISSTSVTPTTTSTTVSNNTPVAIVDAAAVQSQINVAGAGTYLLQAEVQTSMAHTFAADLDVTLQSPAGSIEVLTTDNGGSNDDVFNGTAWRDSANEAPTDHVYTNLTVATPLNFEGSSSRYMGQDPNGTWTLTIADDLAGDTGTLSTWTLNLTTATCGCQLDLTCPGDIVVPAPPGAQSQVVNFADPTVGGTCTSVTASCAPVSGSAFPLGDTNVVCTAVDGVTGTQASCNFTVGVGAQTLQEIPTASTLGLAALALLLAGAAFVALRRG